MTFTAINKRSSSQIVWNTASYGKPSANVTSLVSKWKKINIMFMLNRFTVCGNSSTEITVFSDLNSTKMFKT